MVRVELGFDRFSALVAAEACRAEGYDVEFVQMDANGVHPGAAPLVPHHLLVRRADLNPITEIVGRSFPLIEQDAESLERPPTSGRKRAARK